MREQFPMTILATPPIASSAQQLSKGDCREGQSAALTCAFNFGGRRARKPLRIADCPNQYVSIEQDHFNASQASDGSTGDSISLGCE